MKLKWVLLSAVVACACLAGAFWVLRTQPHKVSEMEIVRAVPLDAVYFCYLEHVDILNETVNNPQSGWSLFTSPETPINRFLQKLQGNAPKNAVVSDILRSKAIYSVHPQGKDHLTSLLSVELAQVCSAEQWNTIYKDLGQAVNVQAYHGTYITTLGSGDTLLHSVAINNVALVSPSLILLQNAIRHLNSESSLGDNEQFKQVAQTVSSSSDVRLFINNRAINSLVTATGSSKWRKYSSQLPYLANWTALDGQASPTVIHLNGFVFPSFSDDNYLSLLLSQSSSETSAWSILPVETEIAFNLGLSDAAGFLDGYKRFLEKRKLLGEYKRRLTALDERLQHSAEKLFLSFYPEEIGVAYIADSSFSGWVSMFKTANKKYVLEQLKALASEQKRPFEATNNKINWLYHNPVKGLLPTLFGEVYAVAGDTYFMVKNDWIIFGDNSTVLNYLNSNELSLKKYMLSTQATKYVSSNSAFSAFIVPGANNTELVSYLHPLLQKNVEKALKGDAFKMSCLQMRSSGNKLYTTLFAIYDNEEKPDKKNSRQPVDDIEPLTIIEAEPELKQEKETAPTTQTQPQAVTQPVGSARQKFTVTNHINKTKEYLTQEADNTVSLTDKNGKTLWTKSVDGPIVDTLYQIDAFKNGKLQMLFVTANKMYLMDRNGQNVAPFPLAMKPAASWLALFDYDKNKDYRLFVVHGGNTVKVYDKKGRAVDGWKAFTAKSTITRAPEFCRVGGRDFIVVCDTKTTYLLDRKGNERLTISTPVIVKPGTPIIIQQQPAALKVTTTEGKKVTINMKDGKVN